MDRRILMENWTLWSMSLFRGMIEGNDTCGVYGATTSASLLPSSLALAARAALAGSEVGRSGADMTS
jgi:hypothetical protein